jgi:hypothetical protein
MEKQIWQLRTSEGGWTSAGQIYISQPGQYYIRYNCILVDCREGMNQIYIWRASNGFHGRYYQEWNFERTNSILPEDVILLKSFAAFT